MDMNRDLLELTIFAGGMFVIWRGSELCLDFDIMNLIKEIIIIFCFSGLLLLFNVFYNNNEKYRMVLCQPYIGQTIIKKQLPNLLVFKDDKFLIIRYDAKQWFERKKVGDLFTKEDCKKIKNIPSKSI